MKHVLGRRQQGRETHHVVGEIPTAASRHYHNQIRLRPIFFRSPILYVVPSCDDECHRKNAANKNKETKRKEVMKHTKNAKVRSGLMIAVITVGLVLSGSSALAADNGSVTVQGTVEPVNEITVTGQTGFNTLNLSAGATDQNVAVVNEKNNDPDGYTVTLVSANAQAASSSQARLKGANTANATVINYSMKYGTALAEAAVTLGATGSAVVTSTSAASPETGSNKNLLITFSGSSWSNADTYSDTITLTIAAK
ncbi:MAG TPA: hypothetical protein VMS21_11410 [Methylomirabilota bacterium]|nr:hypothetical protein [Methylomirabilota bacterium]